MTDQLSGGNPFAPQPKSYGAVAGDYLHQARKWMDDHTPTIGTALSFMGRAGNATAPTSQMGQGGILNDPETMARMNAYVKRASPVGGSANSPSALFGPPTFPGTMGPRPEGFGQPSAAPEAPEATQAAPPLPAPIQVGQGRIGMPMAPQVSDGGFNALDAQANTPPVVASGAPDAFLGPHSVGGAPLHGAGIAKAAPSYDLGSRVVRRAAAIGSGQAEPMSFMQRNTAMMRDPVTGEFIDPQAAKRVGDADATGPDLIKKFMKYLNTK